MAMEQTKNLDVVRKLYDKSGNDLASNVTQTKQLPSNGTCLIDTAVRLFDGCHCTCYLMSDGASTGLSFDAISHTGQFTAGQVVQFHKTHTGSIELIGGGSSGGTSSSTDTSTVVQLFYNMQHGT